MRSLRVSIPEAASSGGTITFKILVAPSTHDSPYPVFRTFPQVRWLHQKLQNTFIDHVIPPLPDALSDKLSEDVDQVEQKRIQIERFLQRICLRSEFATSEAVLWFVGTEMTHLDSVDPKRTALGGFLRFDNIIKPSYDRGLRMYRPTENVEENDQGEFQRRQAYLLSMEQSFTGLLDSGLRLTKEREKLGETYSQLGDATMEVLSSKYRLGDGQRIDNRERHQALDQEMQLFGVLTDDLRLSMRRQAKTETFQFMDMVHEYRSMLQGLKDVMNSRTDRLSDYVAATKRVGKRQTQLEQAIQKAAATVPGASAADGVDKAKIGLESANEKLELARQEFTTSQEVVTRELIRYEKDKAKEWQVTVQDYAGKQLAHEKEKLSALEKAWESIQDLRIGTGGSSGAPRKAADLGVSGQGLEAALGGGGAAGGRSRSYWPSGLGSPFGPDFNARSEVMDEPADSSSYARTLPTHAAAPVSAPAATTSTAAAVEDYRERLPQNAGYSGSGHNSGYNSGYNSSGYNSGTDQDEGVSRSNYFPAAKLSRSGSSSARKSAPTSMTPATVSRKDSLAGMATAAAAAASQSAIDTRRPSNSAVGPLSTSPPLPVESPLKADILAAEQEDKNKDGYDPLMVQPGFTD